MPLNDRLNSLMALFNAAVCSLRSPALGKRLRNTPNSAGTGVVRRLEEFWHWRSLTLKEFDTQEVQWLSTLTKSTSSRAIFVLGRAVRTSRSMRISRPLPCAQGIRAHNMEVHKMRATRWKAIRWKPTECSNRSFAWHSPDYRSHGLWQ